ncbi:MAG: hypothetical protein MUC77_15705 [Chromatiaceae bacterium]|jgi:hypothetical protein|nr:hypothetical protein [Chromatiaceae bacterium]
MTFRITRLDDSQRAVVKIDGQLEVESLAELLLACGDPSSGPTLDLGGLRQADEAALALLRRLAAGGARLVGCPPYLALRLGLPAGPDGHDAF